MFTKTIMFTLKGHQDSILKNEIHSEINTLVSKYNSLMTPSRRELKVQKILNGQNLFSHMMQAQREMHRAECLKKTFNGKCEAILGKIQIKKVDFLFLKKCLLLIFFFFLFRKSII